MRHLKLGFTSQTTVLGELMQNARRAQATVAVFDYDEALRRLTVTDDGCGIADLQVLLTVAESGWDAETVAQEHPFGLGFLSAVYAAERLTVESRGRRLCFATADLLAFRPLEVLAADTTCGTRLVLEGLQIPFLEAALRHRARGFPIEVRFNGEVAVDEVRASRDGHEYHEAWTARKAMQLLLPNSGLAGIAVEGLEPIAQSIASAETVEVADVTVYCGRDATFHSADTVEIIQFKYSVSREDKEFRVSDAKKTVTKFAAAYRDHKKNYSAHDVAKKLRFELITNRPIYPALERAIAGIAEGKRLTDEPAKQATQFKKAAGLAGKPLKDFARKCAITGLSGSLSATKSDLTRILVDWSATPYALATSRIGKVRQLVRDKAGYAGTNRNIIRRVDLLDALDISDVDELLPCPASLPEIGEVVPREQLPEAIGLVPTLDKPLLVHGDGGIGKTVFLDSLASALSEKHEVVFFDCFGSGRYRAAEDARHLPNRGLVHIANTLACRGLCDPLLPGSDSMETLFSVFRKRLEQCIKALSTASPDRLLVVFIDAIDNAAEHAKDRHQPSFPTLLLGTLQQTPIPGLRLILSCRSYRRAISVKDVPCTDFHLQAFTLSESESYITARIPDVTPSEILVAHARSKGNARILEHLATSDRGLLDPSEIDNPIALDDLLKERIETSLAEAIRRGSKKSDIDAFLAGLSVLPPPVPLEEYAGAHNLDVSAIQSFAADLAPLLEHTKHGLMFRDEPTETLVREKYGSDTSALKRVAKNLLARQDQSVYAARALPGLLQKLDDGRKLFALAFDERFPAAITSTVGQRRIRYARLQAAVLHAANAKDSNKLVRLLVELSTIAAVDQKGADYILDNPDLAVIAQDGDALRRLFETRTKWPGARHARLSIANILSGDFDDAYRHEKGAEEWILHDLNRDRDQDLNRTGPEQLDHASTAFFLISQRQADRAIRYMRIWYDWYGFELCEHIFGLVRLAQTSPDQSPDLDGFLDGLTKQIGCIAGALSFLELPEAKCRDLIARLAKACARATKLKSSARYSRQRPYELPDGLRKAAAVAASLGLGNEALKIAIRAPHERPRVWSLQDQHSDANVFPFFFHVALESAVKDSVLHERDILPAELMPIYMGMSKSITGADFRKKLKERLQRRMKKQRDDEGDADKRISGELKNDAERFIDNRLAPLLELTTAFAELLAVPQRQADSPFLKLVNAWVKVRTLREGYSPQKLNYFFQLLGCHMAIFALWARSDLKAASVRIFLQRLHEQPILGPWTLNQVIAILALRPRLHNFAGEQAIQAKALIDNEDDVTTRATLYAQLARAILPAAPEDAAVFFKTGLEQMDAIGSGDYDFTNELLLFASSMKGDELAERDFHTLTNICELNMSYEEQKFPWASFGAGLSKAAGWRALPKLCRWHDRSKIELEYTLLPYLTALIRDSKIEPEDALALNCLADPAELWSCNTETFANAIHEKRFPNERALVTELVRQFEANNPGIPAESTAKALASIARDVLGKGHATTKYLNAAQKRFGNVIHELNVQGNYRPPTDARLGRAADQGSRKSKTELRKLADRTDPTSEESLAVAIEQLNEMSLGREFEAVFFDRLRSKVAFGQRTLYVELLARLEHLDSYAKFRELDTSRTAWAGSSAALAYQELAVPILHIHVEEFLSFERLSGYQLKELSDLTGVPIPPLSLELVKLFAGREWAVPAAAWLGLATIVCGDADEGEGQKALARLLNSNSAQLTSTVQDGGWARGMYPSGDFVAIASGMLWLILGSPRASDRWRAAHCVRCFARFGRWKVIDALVATFPSEDVKGFQAPELRFYYMHARLWLLIALARIALDDPQHVGKYRSRLLTIALDDKLPHVLMKHFAAKALLICVDAGTIRPSKDKETRLRTIDQSPFPPLTKRLKDRLSDEFYRGCPKGTPEPKHKFSLDYDFEKYDVHNLSHVFGQPGWKVRDLMTAEVRAIDATVTTMFESGGREVPTSRRMIGLDSKYHGYGQYLAWHALILVAGRLLAKHPVTEDWHYGEPWTEWLHRRCLTRSDGLWLSDGTDRPPLSTKVNVLERDEGGLVLTGDRTLLKALAGIQDATITSDILVEGRWKSPDGIEVDISSALVPPRKAKRLAKKLIDEEPLFAWLPTYHAYEDEEEHLRSEKKEYEPWIITRDMEGRLDADDPLAVIDVERRPRFVAKVIDDFSLRSSDPFTRIWTTARQKKVATSDAWGRESRYEERSYSGVRLNCSPDLLAKVLLSRNRDLLLLIKLHRYEERVRGVSDSWFSSTVAVVRINKNLKYEYFPGAVNKIHKSAF